jgi:hypothetical protein
MLVILGNKHAAMNGLDASGRPATLLGAAEYEYSPTNF